MSYPKNARDRESDFAVNVSSSSTFLAIRIFFSQLLSPISIEHDIRQVEITSRENEFNFSVITNKITSLHRQLVHGNEDGGNEDSGDVRDVRRKIRIMDSESESHSDCAGEIEPLEWTVYFDSEEIPAKIPFVYGERQVGPQVPAHITEPIDFFKLFFTEELVSDIVQETNNNAARNVEGKVLSSRFKWRVWYNVTITEFWPFIALIIEMRTMPLANIQEYWSKNNTSYMPFYSNTFTRYRVYQIFWKLHLKIIPSQNTNVKTRLQLVPGFFDYINKRIWHYFVPEEQICVDESTVKFKGRISFITYSSMKPTKWGMRVYMLVDRNTGFSCSILPYYGSLTTQTFIRLELPVSTRIPLHLYQRILDKIPGVREHHMFTDHYYTNYILAEEFRKQNCYLTGTILISRNYLPSEIRTPKFENRSTVAYRKGNTLVVAWKDRRVVTTVTTHNNAE